ncbi:MAG: dihydrofolate reductase [Myxococcales bacterium]|nr:dihydrofolate reductase [Myxococcales bacterium]
MSQPGGRRLALIAAVARGGVIGAGGAMPWHLPEDLRHFKRLTKGHAVVMGRRTHESIGRPLPGRRNIVVSRRPGARFDGCEHAESLDAALELAWSEDPCPFVIGGGEIYALALSRATHLYLTEVDREVEGDTLFPPLPEGRFEEVERVPGETPGVVFVTLVRRDALPA